MAAHTMHIRIVLTGMGSSVTDLACTEFGSLVQMNDLQMSNWTWRAETLLDLMKSVSFLCTLLAHSAIGREASHYPDRQKYPQIKSSFI